MSDSPHWVAGVRRAHPDQTLASLAEGSASEARPALLALARAHAERPFEALLKQWQRDTFVAPSPLDQRTALRLDQMALDAASDYEALLLSPVAPLGACSAVAATSQDRTLSAQRITEVVSDPTNCLALACAARLRRRRDDQRVCTVHQVLRAQRFSGEGRTQHFRMLAVAAAGRGRPDDGFVVEAFADQLGVQLRLLELARDAGHAIGRTRCRLSVAAGAETTGDRIAERIGPFGVPVERDVFESAYYEGVRLMLDVDCDGEWANMGDVGRFDWVAKLTSNRKLRFVASGFGLQLLPLLFPVQT